MKKDLEFTRFEQSGFITLISVVVIGTITLAVALAALYSGTTAAKNIIALQQSQQAKMLASSCAEEALLQVRNNAFYVGSSTLYNSAGSCTYSVSLGTGVVRYVNATSTAGTQVRHVAITLDSISSSLHVVSWVE